MKIIYFFEYLVSWMVFLYLSANTFYLLFIALCGRLIKARTFGINADKNRIAVLIPCFKEDQIILDTAKQAKLHDYPASLFSVNVIADKLNQETIQRLKQLSVNVLEVDLNMKSRSLHAALESELVAGFDLVVILDADNIMGPGCLEKINSAFQAGCLAVQCHRTAKNKNTSVAILDAISEEININLFRRGPAVVGLSAAPIGSGMAFQTKLIREIFSTEEILANPGEDREIDIQLMRRKIKMEFLEDAFVYDEKVSSAGVFEKQRVRWLEAQVNHLKRFYDQDMKSAPRTFLYYNKLFQNILLPRVLTLVLFCGVFFVLFVQNILHVNLFHPNPIVWFGVMCLYFFTLLISIPPVFYNWQTMNALSRIPLLMFTMVKAVFQVKKRRAEFIHTPKSYQSGENK